MIRKENLVGNWKLNSGKDSSGNALDYSGNGNSGTIAGTEAYTQNQNSKQTQYFDGSGNYLSITKDVIVSPTFSIIFKENSTSGNTGYFLSDSTDSPNLFVRRTSGGSAVDCQIGEASWMGGGNPITLSNSIDHIHAIVHYSNGDYKWFIDGVYQGKTSGSNFTELTSSLYIGNRSDLARSFGGMLGDVMVFNTDLTATEVKQLTSQLNNPAEFSPKITPSLTSDGVDDYIDLGTQVIESLDFTIKIPNASTGNSAIGPTFGLGGVDAMGVKNGDIVWRTLSGDYYNTPILDDAVTRIQLDKDNNLIVNGVPTTPTLQGSSTGAWTTTRQVLCARYSGGYSSNTHMTIYNYETDLHQLRFTENSGSVIYNKTTGQSSDITGDLEYNQEPLTLDDDSLVFSTRDGITDLSGKNDIVNTDTVVGKGMNFNGTSSFLEIGQQADGLYTVAFVLNCAIAANQYIFDARDSGGVGYSFLDSSGVLNTSSGTIYINGVASSQYSPEFSNAHVVITGLTLTNVVKIFIGQRNSNDNFIQGTMSKVQFYNEVKSADWVKQDYEKEVRLW